MRKATVSLAAVLAVCAGAVTAPASALAAPMLRLTSSTPDYVTPGKGMLMFVYVRNVGDKPLNGNVTVNYTFPVGVAVADPLEYYGRPGFPRPTCTPNGQQDECVVDATGLPPGGQFGFKTPTTVSLSASGALPGSIEVSGGGAAKAVSESFTLYAEPAGPFAFKSYGVGLFDELGNAVTQAGTDPGEQSTSLAFVSEARVNLNLPNPNFYTTASAESYRDVTVHVPAGFIGDPTATARCAPSQLTTPIENTVIPLCPLDSQVGVVDIYPSGTPVPLYSIQPPAGYPAEFGFFYNSIVVRLLAKLRPSDNGIDIVTAKIPNSVPIPKFEVTLWGDPSAVSHDPLRGHCLQGGFGNNGENCALQESERSAVPFLRMPTSCTGEPLQWGVEVDTYQHVGTWLTDSTETPAVTGCENVPFTPSFSLSPSTTAPHAASGADATVSLPQDAGAEGVAQADVKSTTVTLPAGLTLNPSAANGLQACSDAQLRQGLEGPSECPGVSQIGTVTLKTRLLDHEIGGSIFVLDQKSSEPQSGEMFRVAIEIRSDKDGVDIKLPGHVKVDPVTGQITTSFEDLPQLPFEAMTLHFDGAAEPVLVSPESCGTYETEATLTGWNGKSVQHSSPFTLGKECSARGFAPGFAAGTTNPVAGAFTSFALQLTRTDGDQELSSLSPLTFPRGLVGDIGSVAQCSEAQVAAAACPEASRLGSLTVGAGVGASPVYITGGNVYLTGPYKGAPFGLAFMIDAKAGPYDLGMVTVRAALNIDPHTAQAVVEAEPFPTMIKGVPVRLRDLRVSIDRPHFMLNPTSCEAMSIAGTANSVKGTTAAVSSRFQVGECASLKFKPKFSALIHARHGRKNGEYLHVVVRSGEGQANIGRVHVKLPAKLPARLDTLKLACTEAQFGANPAGCPAGSFVGHAVAYTPILGTPMEGPAIFVSHGSAAFPNLDLVLQGSGVTVILEGDTFINKKSITTSTFKSVPDVPISRFDLVLPEGPHSALSGSGDMCSKPLYMPTRLTGQNGAVKAQRTRIKVEGCKPEIRVLGHSVKGAHAQIRVSVPSAGMLVAGGKDIERSVKQAKHAGMVSIDVTLNAHDRQVLAKNPTERVNAKVRLRFVPKHGKPLSSETRLLMG